MDKKLLILDLDETLVFGTEQPLIQPWDFQVGPYFVYRRPFLTEFLRAVFDWFEVAVWSSASRLYVDGVVEQLFPDRGALRFVWASERCTQCFDAEQRNYYWLKNLKKVKRLGYPLERVLMIDDSPRKIERQYGNHLPVRPFLGRIEDEELRLLIPYLDWLRNRENIRIVEKRYWRDRLAEQ